MGEYERCIHPPLAPGIYSKSWMLHTQYIPSRLGEMVAKRQHEVRVHGMSH
jgi:hypothetical protein